MVVQTLSSTPTVPVTASSGAIRYVDWGAIFAGTVIAVAMFSILATFGSAIGLSLSAMKGTSAISTAGLLVAAALWGLWVQISSYMAGAYVTGRLRHRIGDADPHEVEMRDGAHGLVMWAVGVIISGLFASWIAFSGVSAVAGLAQSAGADNVQYYAETLMRPASGSSQPGASSQIMDSEQTARILGRIVISSDESDEAYLVSKISSSTGLPEAEAKARLDEITKEMKDAAETARRSAIVLAFFTAVSLLLSAVGAWWAAQKGGEHRDQGTDYSHLTRWR